MKPKLHFVPNVKFSRLQRSLKKIHSEELDTGIVTHHFGRSVQFSEGKCSASDLDPGKETASLCSERKIF